MRASDVKGGFTRDTLLLSMLLRTVVTLGIDGGLPLPDACKRDQGHHLFINCLCPPRTEWLSPVTYDLSDTITIRYFAIKGV